MANTISFKCWFDLQIIVKKCNMKRVEGLLDENNYKYSWLECKHSFFAELRVNKVNIRKAEVLRHLLKHLSYD